MTIKDYLGVFLNTFEKMVQATEWPEEQWAAVLIPCLIKHLQQAVDTLPTSNLTNYKKVNEIIQTLNLSPEVYWRWLSEIKFRPGIIPVSCAKSYKWPAYDSCDQWYM